jgi:hypothetical protein
MQCLLSSPNRLGASDLDASPTFNVVIAYEDFDTGKHAKRTYDFLVENLGRECQFTNQMWKFDVLSIPKLREMAAKDAVQADIIIVSSHGGDELPEPVKAWIESWLAEKGNVNALVALFDCPDEDSLKTRRIRTYLADVAERGGMEFFAQPDDWPGRRTGTGPLQSRHDSDLDPKTSSTLTSVLQQDTGFPRWGINE